MSKPPERTGNASGRRWSDPEDKSCQRRGVHRKSRRIRAPESGMISSRRETFPIRRRTEDKKEKLEDGKPRQVEKFQRERQRDRERGQNGRWPGGAAFIMRKPHNAPLFFPAVIWTIQSHLLGLFNLHLFTFWLKKITKNFKFYYCTL